MNNKGFTLIELLAVIVILAIIALIATPVILGIIDDASEESTERSVENYLNAVNTAVVNENLKRPFNPSKCEIQANGNIICEGYAGEVKVDIDGVKPSGGEIFFVNGVLDRYHNIKFDNDYYTIGEEVSKTPYEPTCKLVAPTDTNSDGTPDKGDINGNGKADVGDLIDCGGQRFYVVENTNGKIQMLAEYNITLDLPENNASA